MKNVSMVSIADGYQGTNLKPTPPEHKQPLRQPTWYQ